MNKIPDVNRNTIIESSLCNSLLRLGFSPLSLNHYNSYFSLFKGFSGRVYGRQKQERLSKLTIHS